MIAQGRPAPWAGLSQNERTKIDSSLVQSRLASVRHEAVRRSGRPDHGAGNVGGAQPSAVLLLIFDLDGEARVVLTRRSMSLPRHRGEVSFPGGRAEEGETPQETALREANEEIGVRPDDVRVVGSLGPTSTITARESFVPVVGVTEGRPIYAPNPDEVDRVFDVELSWLLADGNYAEQLWSRRSPDPAGGAVRETYVQFYRVPGELVWGATARVLTDFLCRVLGLDWPDPVGSSGGAVR